MPNRPKKRRRYPVDEGLPVEQPPGEDFFLADVIIDSHDPCWNDGFNVTGPWKTVSKAVSRFIAYGRHDRKFTVKIYQGDTAMKMLARNVAEEVRYQQQRRAQPNN